MVNTDFDPTLENRRIRVTPICDDFKQGLKSGWEEARLAIRIINQKASDDKPFRRMVLAQFLIENVERG